MGAILVTGGAGYVGSHVVLALRDVGETVVVVDDLSTGHRRLLSPDVPLYVGSAADGALIDAVVAGHGVSAVMHFAGSISAPESAVDPLKYFHNNTSVSRSLIEHAVRNGVRHFIFSSTAAVYGLPGVSPVSEATPARPASPYGASKWMTEVMLAAAATAHGLNFCALRYFNVAGADPAGRAGPSNPCATHLIKVAARVAVGAGDGVTIHGTDYATPDGSGVRDYIHVSDLAQAHIAALAHLARRPDESLTLNCGYGRGVSVFEVLDAVDRVSGRTLKRTLGPRRAGDVDALVADVERIRAKLDWRPRFNDLNLIVAHALAWERGLLADPVSAS